MFTMVAFWVRRGFWGLWEAFRGIFGSETSGNHKVGGGREG